MQNNVIHCISFTFPVGWSLSCLGLSCTDPCADYQNCSFELYMSLPQVYSLFASVYTCRFSLPAKFQLFCLEFILGFQVATSWVHCLGLLPQSCLYSGSQLPSLNLQDWHFSFKTVTDSCIVSPSSCTLWLIAFLTCFIFTWNAVLFTFLYSAFIISLFCLS